jgi:hypothetical protein
MTMGALAPWPHLIDLNKLSPSMICTSVFIPAQWSRAGRISPPISISGKGPWSQDPQATGPFNVRQDMTTGAHARLATSTRVLESTLSSLDIATPPREHA